VEYDSIHVLFWLTLAAAAVFLTVGALWLIAPRVYSRSLPDDGSQVWSLPWPNGLAAIHRLVRWTSRTRIRQIVWGSCGVAGGVYLIWLAFNP
jgi:hypothetical protein